MHRLAKLACAGVCLFLPLLAHAYDGIVTANVNLRAGPDIGYPAVRVLPAGVPVAIQGCLDGWTWCDVVAGPDRGWVAGTYLENVYDGRRVVVTDYGARIGIPVVAFALGAYWDHYYRGRPWYRERSVWERRRFGHRPPPRPPHYRGRGYDGGRYGIDHGRGNRYDGGRNGGRHDEPRRDGPHGAVHGQTGPVQRPYAVATPAHAGRPNGTRAQPARRAAPAQRAAPAAQRHEAPAGRREGGNRRPGDDHGH
ncbi:MAG TPA: SH3 domain-containing protein [Dokdonella sp.]